MTIVTNHSGFDWLMTDKSESLFFYPLFLTKQKDLSAEIIIWLSEVTRISQRRLDYVLTGKVADGFESLLWERSRVTVRHSGWEKPPTSCRGCCLSDLLQLTQRIYLTFFCLALFCLASLVILSIASHPRLSMIRLITCSLLILACCVDLSVCFIIFSCLVDYST